MVSHLGKAARTHLPISKLEFHGHELMQTKASRQLFGQLPITVRHVSFRGSSFSKEFQNVALQHRFAMLVAWLVYQAVIYPEVDIH